MNNTPHNPKQNPNNAGQDPVVEEIDLSFLQVEEINAPAPKQEQAPPQQAQQQAPQQQAPLPSQPKRSHQKSFNFKALILSFCVIGGVIWYVTSNTDLIKANDDIPALKNKDWGTELKLIETPQEEHLATIISNRDPEKNEPLDELVKALEAVDNVNLYLEDSFSILSLAVSKNDTAAVKLLLQAKANPNLDPKSNPLNIAIEKKNISILNLLLDAGASPYPNKARKDSPPLLECIYNSYVEGAEALLSHGCDPNVKFESPDESRAPMPPLFFNVVGSKENKQELCLLLIKHGAKLNETYLYKKNSDKKYTINLINYASLFPDEEFEKFQIWLTKKVLDYDKNAINYIIPENGRSTLTTAIETKSFKLAEFLLSQGADPNIGSYASIFTAAFKKNTAILKLLLEAGADPNKTMKVDNGKLHPLGMAIYAEQKGLDSQIIETVNMLLAAGSDPKKCDEEDYSTVIDIICQKNLKDNTKLQLLREFLKRKANPEGLASSTLTPLHISLFNNDEIGLKMAQELIKAGADINAKHNGESPLIHACAIIDPQIVKFLLSNGADMEVLNKNGDNSLVMVIKNAHSGNSEDAQECLRLLLDAGADKNARKVQQAAEECSVRAIQDLILIKIPSKKTLLADISTAGPEAGKRSIAAIDRALKNADSKEKRLLERLKACVKEVYILRAKTRRTEALNAQDENSIIKCENNAARNASSRHIGGGSAISMARREMQKAEMLRRAIEKRTEDLNNSINSTTKHLKSIVEPLKKAGRTEDAEIIENCINTFSEADEF